MTITVRRRLATVLTSALVVAGLAGCTGAGAPTTPTASVPTSPAPTGERMIQPVGVVATNDAVWVASSGDSSVRRVGGTSAAVRVTVGDTPLRLAYDGKLVWASVFRAGSVVAVDPASNTVVKTVQLGGQPEGIASAFGGVWVVRQEAKQLTRLNSDGSLAGHYPVGTEPRLVAASDRYVFVSNFGDGTVSRVDPTSQATKTSAKLCDGAQGLATGPGILWVTCTPAGRLLAVDPERLTVLGALDLAGEPDAVHIIDATVWVALAIGPTLVRIGGTPAAPTIANRYLIADNPGLDDRANVDFAVFGGQFWISAPQAGQVYHRAIS